MKPNIFCIYGKKKKICFTGFSEEKELKDLANLVELLGGEPTSELTKKTLILVANKVSEKVKVSICDNIISYNIIYYNIFQYDYSRSQVTLISLLSVRIF